MTTDRPDPDRLLDTLSREERRTVLGWADELELPWYRIVPLLAVVEQLAVYRVARELVREMDLPAGDAVRAAAEALGLEDDDARATHPGDRFHRRLRRWRHAGHSVQSPTGGGA